MTKSDLKSPEFKCPSCKKELRLLWESEDLYVCQAQNLVWKQISVKRGLSLKLVYSPSDYRGPDEFFDETSERKEKSQG